jgi:hypothetical protein
MGRKRRVSTGFIVTQFSPRPKNKKLNRRGRGARREKGWKIGMMECWNIKEPIVLPIIPLFQYSSIPIPFLCGSFFSSSRRAQAKRPVDSLKNVTERDRG